MINNPVAQIAHMYNLLEAHLRRAAGTNTPINVPTLNKQGDIAALTKSPWQVRDLLKSLDRRGYVIHKGNGFVWDISAGPFVISNRSLQRSRTEPSEPTVHRIKAPKPTLNKMPELTPRRVAVAKEIELVLGGTLVVIGRNDVTGRLRIIIEDAG